MSLFKSISNYGDNVALISELTGPLTYNDLIKKTDVIQKYVPERSLVFLISKNTVAPLICYIASIRNNCIVMLVDVKTSRADILNLVETYKPSFLVVPINWFENSTTDGLTILENIYDYSIYRTNYQKLPKMNNDLSVLLPTSGSMGSPKYVRLSHQNLKANADSIINFLKMESKDRTVTTMTYSYSFMLSIINTHIESGASILVCDYSVTQKKFWEQFKNNKVTSLSGVPYIFDIFLKLGLNKIYTPFLRTFTHAGGKLDNKSAKKILEFCEQNNIKFTMMYGQTEATARMAYLDWRDAPKKIGSIGKSIPFTKMWLENKKGEKVKKSGEVGELIFKGKNVSMGYANNCNDLNKTDENKGILRTGDLAIKDQDGFFYIIGRKSRDIKLFGHRINLDEIEQILFEKGYNCSCCGSDNEVTIFHVDSTYNSEILEYISKTINIHPDCFKLKHIKKFPLNENGKVSYKKLETFL
jgi:acyl-coenzyme A synthetase/AMP-(fatty) acid ligase